MDRGLKAAFLFSLLVVAQADRALLAHKPNQGGLHAVALLRSTVPTSLASAVTFDGIFNEASIKTVGNYLITNGNGTWTYSYYSNNGILNNNDAGMGGDYSFPNYNIAWFNANAALGTAITLGVGGGPSAVNALGPVAPSFDDTSSFGYTLATGTSTGGVYGAITLESPVALYTVGLTAITFTGAKTGIAVGRFGGFSDVDQLTFVAGTPGIPVAIGQQKLNILLTYDGATTWTRATGLPKPDAIVAVSGAVNPVVFGTQGAGTWGAVGTGSPTGASTAPPYPSITPGDLTSVFFASKTLGWAVGGNDVNLALVTSNSGLGITGTVNTVVATATTTPFGSILITQNGGSVWKIVPIWTAISTLQTLWLNNDASLKVIFNTPMPGILFGVQSDASGKHVYAVGSGPSLFSSTTGTLTYIVNNVVALGSAPAQALQVKPYGTILYSGNSGLSWVQQVAPTLYTGSAPYALFDVAVQKGTTAVAVGGSPGVKFGEKSAGTIIYTMNGGFTWTQAVYPSSTGSKAPVFTTVALQPAMAGLQQIWVGGFTTRTDTKVGSAYFVSGVQSTPTLDGTIAYTLPIVTGGLTATGGSPATTVYPLTGGTAGYDFYPLAAQSGSGNPFPSGVTVSSNQYSVKGNIYTILMSKDGGKTFAAAPTAGLPTGFVLTSNTHGGTTNPTFVTDRSVYGITWDNAHHGWIYGYGFIIATHDGGVTWVYETPADVGVTSVTPKVLTIASVPTTY